MIKKIDSLQDWDLLFNNRNSESEIIILKTSHRCSVSMFAKRQFDNWANNLSAEDNLTIYEIDVIYQRDISNRIAEDLLIKHQSPQVVWLNKDKTVKCYLNHDAINVRNLSDYYEGKNVVKQGFFAKYFK